MLLRPALSWYSYDNRKNPWVLIDQDWRQYWPNNLSYAECPYLDDWESWESMYDQMRYHPISTPGRFIQGQWLKDKIRKLCVQRYTEDNGSNPRLPETLAGSNAWWDRAVTCKSTLCAMVGEAIVDRRSVFQNATSIWEEIVVAEYKLYASMTGCRTPKCGFTYMCEEDQSFCATFSMHTNYTKELHWWMCEYEEPNIFPYPNRCYYPPTGPMSDITMNPCGNNSQIPYYASLPDSKYCEGLGCIGRREPLAWHAAPEMQPFLGPCESFRDDPANQVQQPTTPLPDDHGSHVTITHPLPPSTDSPPLFPPPRKLEKDTEDGHMGTHNGHMGTHNGDTAQIDGETEVLVRLQREIEENIAESDMEIEASADKSPTPRRAIPESWDHRRRLADANWSNREVISTYGSLGKGMAGSENAESWLTCNQTTHDMIKPFKSEGLPWYQWNEVNLTRHAHDTYEKVTMAKLHASCFLFWPQLEYDVYYPGQGLAWNSEYMDYKSCGFVCYSHMEICAHAMNWNYDTTQSQGVLFPPLADQQHCVLGHFARMCLPIPPIEYVDVCATLYSCRIPNPDSFDQRVDFIDRALNDDSVTHGLSNVWDRINEVGASIEAYKNMTQKNRDILVQRIRRKTDEQFLRAAARRNDHEMVRKFMWVREILPVQEHVSMIVPRDDGYDPRHPESRFQKLLMKAHAHAEKKERDFQIELKAQREKERARDV